MEFRPETGDDAVWTDFINLRSIYKLAINFDADGNGAIDNANQMFNGPGAAGFAALAQHDDNGDGATDASRR